MAICREVLKSHIDVSHFIESSSRLLYAKGSAATNSDVVVFDSSFNPPTVAHEHMAQLARNYGKNICLMLSVLNADKPVDTPSNLQHRVNMMRLMAGCQDADIALSKAPRFIDKLEFLLEYGKSVTFVMGADTLIRVIDPKYYKDPSDSLAWFFGNCHVICLSRAGEKGPIVDSAYNPKVEYVEMDIPVSSTQARKEILSDGSTQCVNSQIMEYIRENKLYSSS